MGVGFLSVLALFLTAYVLIGVFLRRLTVRLEKERNDDAYFDLDEQVGPPSIWDRDSAPVDGRSPPGDPRTICPHCETANDPGYRYCGSCVNRLTPR